MDWIGCARTRQIQVRTIRHETREHLRGCVKFSLMHTTGSRGADVSATIIGLKERADVDHGQAGVVQEPIVHVSISVVNGLRRTDVYPAI